MTTEGVFMLCTVAVLAYCAIVVFKELCDDEGDDD